MFEFVCVNFNYDIWLRCVVLFLDLEGVILSFIFFVDCVIINYKIFVVCQVFDWVDWVDCCFVRCKLYVDIVMVSLVVFGCLCGF